MSEPSADVLQTMLDGPWRYAPGARRACQENDWASFLSKASPPPSWFQPLNRLAWDACLKVAASLFRGPERGTARLIPVWVGDNPDECSGPLWFAAHAMSMNDGDLGILEYSPMMEDAPQVLDAVVTTTGLRWGVGHIVRSTSYAPSVPLALRKGKFGVLEGEVFVVDSVKCTSGALVARPDVDVPPFSMLVEPRIEGLSDETVDAIRALSITTGDIDEGR